MSKQELRMNDMAAKVGLEIGMPPELVKQVIETFSVCLGQALNERYRVIMRCLGTFQMKDIENVAPDVVFTPSFELKKLITMRADMNKYGVILDENKSLTAKLTGKCPKCGAALEELDPPKCENCGTKPFEDLPQLEEGND